MFDGLQCRHWRTETRSDRIVVLTLDRADDKVNALSRAVLDELELIVERLAIERPAGVVFASGKAAGFIPGADIREFQQFDAEGSTLDRIQAGQRLFQRIAELPMPTVAAIHGHCMGGGTELALACRHRVASDQDDTRIGLPEVKLGIYPGWGGSVRLPLLVGAPAAMDLMLTGRALSAKAARAMGLIDQVAAPALLLDAAIGLAQRPPTRPVQQRLLAWASNLWPVRQILAPILVKQVARKARREHYPAPFALIDTWRRAGGSMQARLAAEARSVARLAKTDTARNLVRVYFLQEALKGLGGGDHGITSVHVVGAGVMGGDIAAWCALKGMRVSVQDRELASIEPALARAATLFEKKVRDPEQRAATLARLNADVEGSGVSGADLVIEAIFENLDAKRALFADVEARLTPIALLASNTSSIPLADLASGLAHRERFAGLHFFNPVAMMPLVEIVRHDAMADATADRLAAFCRAIGKLPVVVAGSPGFLVNRVLFPYMLEAMTCYNEGIPGPAIDRAALAFGMPMGPIELADTVGLDIAASVARVLTPFLGLEIPKGLEGKIESGKRGRKDGQGFYTWENGRARKPELPKDYRAPDDLQDRLILPLVNEAVACLHEGVVADADLLDAGVIFGTGFAPFRGGPIQYARQTGAAVLTTRLRALADRHGPRFAAKPGWDAL